jgi:hypothetical protein
MINLILIIKYIFYIERIKYLGMTVVGESDGGIIVGSIMKGYFS